MYKNEHIHIIEFNNLSLENLMQAFYKCADIVFFTKEHIFDGAGTTKGDIKRYFKSNKKGTSISEVVNTHMRYITFVNEKQAFDEAEKLLAENRRIENIPVINQSGKLLFQIDRYNQQEANINYILDAIRVGSIEYFLEAGEVKKIILTGAEHSCLSKAKEILEEHCAAALIEIVDDVQDCCFIDKKVKIICLNDNGAFYINHNTEFQMSAVSVKELPSFIDFSNVENFDKSIIKVWISVFKYDSVVFCSSNRYVLQLQEMIRNCGAAVYDWKSYALSNGNISDDFLSSLDVLLFSKNGSYCEKMQVTKMIRNIGLLCAYKQISGHNLTDKVFMEGCIGFLKYMQQEKFAGVQYEIDGLWKEKLSDKIKQECDIEVINAAENRLCSQSYVINTDASIRTLRSGDYICDLLDNFLNYVCEKAAYKLMCRLCKNVYIFPVQEHVVMDRFKAYLDRERYNFIHNRSCFPDNFVKDICGDERYPLDDVLHDIQDCQIVKINDGYTKYLSNYRTPYFNTDAYDRRLVTDMPMTSSRTIWLIGGCEFAGYVVEDKHTPASLLQKKINESGYPYRVVNLSHDSAAILTLYKKVLDSNIDADDIIVFSGHAFVLRSRMVHIDYKQMDSELGEKIWYWNSVAHPGGDGYKIYAERIFDTIKADLIMDTGKRKEFSVEKQLESKIHNFIAALKEKLEMDGNYQAICRSINIGQNRKRKVGAIVMNCNPFTYGHQFLVETASRLVDLLYIFVVEENKSVFPFSERFYMVKEGTSQYQNVVAVPSGEFMISSVTFPGYFLKDSPTKECYDTFLDLKIFAHYIAPAFGISVRFVGEEPTDRVTAQYNLDMAEILGDNGINVIEIPRKRCGGDVISAGRVRRLADRGDYASLEKYIPENGYEIPDIGSRNLEPANQSSVAGRTLKSKYYPK